MKGDLQQLVLSSDIERLVGLEGCLSGNVPASALAAGRGSERPVRSARSLAEHQGRVRSGHVRQRGGQPDRCAARGADQAAEAAAVQAERAVSAAALARGLGASEARALGRQASKITTARFQEGLATLALQYGLTARPSLDDHNFVSTLVFDSSKPAGTPKQRFAYLFPSRDSALVSVRMKAGLSESARTRTIGRDSPGGRDAPMAAAARGVLPGDRRAGDRLRSEPLDHPLDRAAADRRAAGDGGDPRPGLLRPPAPAAAGRRAARGRAHVRRAVARGRVADDGLDRRAAVLVGLAVDYAIQFQSRVQEGFAQNCEDTGGHAAWSATAPPASGAPTIATAGAASAAAMLVLVLSPVPMVRKFGPPRRRRRHRARRR